jgi:hypothetical protein
MLLATGSEISSPGVLSSGVLSLSVDSSSQEMIPALLALMLKIPTAFRKPLRDRSLLLVEPTSFFLFCFIDFIV